MVLPNKVYSVLKWLLITVVPASIALITGLGVLYGFDTEVITGTISLVATFLGAIVGISNYNFKKVEADE